MKNKENTASSGSSTKSSYTIPEELQPVWTWKDGYSAAETRQFRQLYGPTSGVTADDVGSYAVSKFSEIAITAIVHRVGQVAELGYEPLQEVGRVPAATILGTMTLEEMMNDPRSRMKAIAVVHNGKIVFERYIGMRSWDNHLWASATKVISGILMYIAESDGLVDIEKPLTSYIPELENTD